MTSRQGRPRGGRPRLIRWWRASDALEAVAGPGGTADKGEGGTGAGRRIRRRGVAQLADLAARSAVGDGGACQAGVCAAAADATARGVADALSRGATLGPGPAPHARGAANAAMGGGVGEALIARAATAGAGGRVADTGRSDALLASATGNRPSALAATARTSVSEGGVARGAGRAVEATGGERRGGAGAVRRRRAAAPRARGAIANAGAERASLAGPARSC